MNLALADLAVDTGTAPGPVLEVAGPREESMVALAELVAAKRGNGLRIEAVDDEQAYGDGRMLPGAGAVLAGPTFEEWLTSR